MEKYIKNITKSLAFLFAFIITTNLNAQIFPPNFLCLNGDTLIWETPTNICGTFVAYEIYASQDINGPFNLLGTVTDENATSFFHAGAGGGVWYYYLLSDFDCPGQMQVPSDTLDNRPPEVAVIEAVTVENGLVRINWNPSPSPEVVGYIIYNETNIGVVPVDTVFGDVTYLDLNSDPIAGSESYFVNALDACGNTSIFDNAHSTMILANVIDPCTQSIIVSWDLYQNWLNPIEKHEVYISENGGTFNLAATVGGGDITATIPNLNDGQDYCFFVKAIESNTGAFSDSPVSCETIEIVQPIRDLYIKSINVTANNEIEILWGWNSDAEITDIDIWRALPNDDVISIIANQNPTDPLTSQGTFLDNSANPQIGNVAYEIQTTDQCDTINLSGFSESIFLAGTAVGGQNNQLTWTALSIENTFSISYEIFKIVGNDQTLLTTVAEPATTHFDPINVSNPAEANACYFVVANYTLANPDGSLEQLRMRSNIACIEQDAEILVPNAFVPHGVNREFKPLISFGDAAAYEMNIYDRYGKKLFTSTDADIGWKGKYQGEDMPQGTYVYWIRVTQSSGKIAEVSGVVVLLR